MGLRDKILNANDKKTETVHVDAWDVDILVVSMSGGERATLMEKGFDPNGGVKVRQFYPEVLINCARDPETNERIFTPADRDALLGKDGAALDVVMEVALRLSGMMDRQKEDIKSPNQE